MKKKKKRIGKEKSTLENKMIRVHRAHIYHENCLDVIFGEVEILPDLNQDIYKVLLLKLLPLRIHVLFNHLLKEIIQFIEILLQPRTLSIDLINPPQPWNEIREKESHKQSLRLCEHSIEIALLVSFSGVALAKSSPTNDVACECHETIT